MRLTLPTMVAGAVVFDTGRPAHQPAQPRFRSMVSTDSSVLKNNTGDGFYPQINADCKTRLFGGS
jgi:hypothetical protein